MLLMRRARLEAAAKHEMRNARQRANFSDFLARPSLVRADVLRADMFKICAWGL
jgi:hypothetical protein